MAIVSLGRVSGILPKLAQGQTFPDFNHREADQEICFFHNLYYWYIQEFSHSTLRQIKFNHSMIKFFKFVFVYIPKKTCWFAQAWDIRWLKKRGNFKRGIRSNWSELFLALVLVMAVLMIILDSPWIEDVKIVKV